MLVDNKILPKEINELFDDIIDSSYQKITSKEKKIIHESLVIAFNGHDGQDRKSGEPYIYHPLEVAKIVAKDIGLDYISIAAAILHDTVEDTEVTLEDIDETVGSEISKIVNGLTKISTLKKNEDYSIQAENYRKMLLTLHDDIRVILIKTADRLHNMRTIDFLSKAKQDQMASESLYIYAPLAHRVGLYNIKNELEDLSLRILETRKYNLIKNKIDKEFVNQEKYVESFKNLINNSLDDQKIKYSIIGRNKSIYSIHNKIQKKNISFDEVYDRFAVRIIYDAEPVLEKLIAWKIYSIVTDVYRPNPTRLRDWISTPKSNGYEALHITVVGPNKRWIEVQIRSTRMHEIAERGYAAHYKYKLGDDKESGLEIWLNRLQEVLKNPDSSAVNFVEDFKLNLYADEIFVFTPEGDLKSLPKGSTALDFAFHIHSGLGLKTRGIKVNGKIVPLSYKLSSGEQVQIIKSNNSKPSASWLDFVITSKAKSAIRSSIKENKKKIAEEGKEILRRKLKQLKISFNENNINKIQTFFNLQTSLDLFYRIGIGTIDNSDLKKYANSQNAIIKFFRRKVSEKPIKKQDDEINTKYDQLVFGNEDERLDYTLSNCCRPLPGDKVFGFVTINEGIKVHKSDCKNALSLQSKFAYRILKSKWIDSTQHDYTSTIQIVGIDNIGLVNKITTIISDNLSINMRKMSFDTEGDVFKGSITLRVKNKKIIDKLIQRIKKIKGVYKAVRD